MADFSNFELGDNVYELADGLLLEMANVFEVELNDEPNSEALSQLVGAIGRKKTLQDNKEGAKAWLTEQTGSPEQALDLTAGWLGRSGVQSALNRSLWTPELAIPDDADIIFTGAVANWQDRATKLVVTTTPRQVFIAVGQRIMDTATEQTNSNVATYREAYGSWPNETQYAENVVVPALENAGHGVFLTSYETESGDEIAGKFVEENPQLLAGYLAFARVANAGIQLAVQFRNAARRLRADFDVDRSDPQVYILTDDFSVARTEEQAANAKEFQNPYTGIRQIALTGKLLVEASA